MQYWIIVSAHSHVINTKGILIFACSVFYRQLSVELSKIDRKCLKFELKEQAELY